MRALLSLALTAALLSLSAPAPLQAQDNSCRWANDNECDEPRYGGTGACENGTDTSDCRAEASAMARLMAAVPADLRARLGNDSCRWAYDLECDDLAFGGTGACTGGTDATDCRALAIGGDDSCRWAHDGECDEPNIGTGVCASGSDVTDCRSIAFLRNRTNNCEFAFNGTCDEPGRGSGQCLVNTDTADCVGRMRPAEARDHYFGHDDRVLIRPVEMPWAAAGSLRMTDGSCTGMLIGPRLVVTAAHCLLDERGQTQIKPQIFRAGAWGDTELARAGISAQIVAPDYSPQSRGPNGGNGDDWALVTLDRDLGLTVGFVRPYVLQKSDIDRINRGEEFRISQAGYSWDTGEWLSGHLDCRILTVYRDGSFIHDCDTTRGDSGSPILTMIDGEWRLVAVDSQFFAAQPPHPTMSTSHLAVDTRAFVDELRAAGALD